MAKPGKGVISIVRCRKRIPIAKLNEIAFGVNHLELNVLTEAELTAIRAEYHIPESVVMRIPGPLESLNNSGGEVVFFTDTFKHWLRLPMRSSV